MGAQIGQLLHGDGGGGSADAGGHHAHPLPQQLPRPGLEFPVGLHVYRPVKALGDGPAPARVAGEDAVFAHVPLAALDMKLHGAFLFVHGSDLLAFFSMLSYPVAVFNGGFQASPSLRRFCVLI